MRNAGTILWHLSSGDQFRAVKKHEEFPIKIVTIWQITTFVFGLDIYQAGRALIPDAWMKVCMTKLINQLSLVLNHLSYLNGNHQCALLHILMLHSWSDSTRMCLCWGVIAMGQTTNSKSSIVEILFSFSWETLVLCFDLKPGIWWITRIAFSLIKPQIMYFLTHRGCEVSLESMGMLLLKSLAFQKTETDSKNSSHFKVLKVKMGFGKFPNYLWAKTFF